MRNRIDSDGTAPIGATVELEVAPASTMTRKAFAAVCVLTGAVMLLVAGFVRFMTDAGQPAPPVPGVPLVAGLLLVAVGALAAGSSRLPSWLGPSLAVTLIGLTMAALSFNGLMALMFLAPLVVLLHLLLSPGRALWATVWVSVWPISMLSQWHHSALLPYALKAWVGAMLVGLMAQFIVRQNRIYARTTRSLVEALDGANRELRDSVARARAAHRRAQRLADQLAQQLTHLQDERDRARAARESAEAQRNRANDALMHNLVLQHEQERLFRLLQASTAAMPQGLFILDARGGIEFANRRAWSLMGVDASAIAPQETLVGLIRHRVSQGFFAPAAASLIWEAVLEVEQWLAHVSASGPGMKVPDTGPHAGTALHEMRLFTGWPMAFAPDGGLELATGRRQDAAVAGSASEQAVPHGLALSVMGRTAAGRILQVESKAVVDGGVVCVYTDVTELVGNAEALGHALADLRAKDAELQAEVMRSRSEVDLNNRFVASVSHEIRTAVQGVTGIMTVLEQAAHDQAATSLVQDLDTSTRSLGRLSEDLLDLVKFRRLGFTIIDRVFDPVAMLDRCIHVVSARLRSSDVLIERDVPSRVVPLIGDEQRVSQVVTNLLDNAVKFTARGRIRIELEVAMADTGEEFGTCTLRVRVADTGRGIPYGLSGRIFEPFDQGEGSTARLHGGVGLGLALSMELCEAMGGDIRVMSRHGVGSVFDMQLRLRLPSAEDRPRPACHPDPDVRQDLPAVRLAGPQQTQAALAGRHVLVVDDNRINRTLMSMWISAQGAQVTTAADGDEGVRLASAADFDCILMDVSMPVLNGLDAARAIRAGACAGAGPAARAARAHIPLIGVTAMARREDHLLCLAAGMDSHLAKPVNKQVLIREIQRVITAHQWLTKAREPLERIDLS